MNLPGSVRPQSKAKPPSTPPIAVQRSLFLNSVKQEFSTPVTLAAHKVALAVNQGAIPGAAG